MFRHIVLAMPNPQELPGHDWLWPGEVARAFGVSTDTIARWADDGRIPSHSLPSGSRRYLRSEIVELLPKAAS